MFKQSLMAALTATTILFGAAGVSNSAQAAAPACKVVTKVSLGVSIYVGWQPWYWANQTGALKAAGAKRCLDISVNEFPGYGPSIDAYTAQQVDALVITNMDALISPVASGVDTTVVLVGDYSDGNDAILSKDKTSIRQLKGQSIYRLQNSVTDYLIESALSQNGMRSTDVNLENLDDSTHESAFEGQDSVRNLGTWNPITLHLQRFTSPAVPTVHTLFTSHQIPGQIQDLTVVNSKLLKAHPEVGDALAEAWYQGLSLMQKGDTTALGIMASTASSSLPEYQDQLKTTHMFYTPADASAFATSQEMIDITTKVRDFCYARGLMGQGNNNPDAIGISFPNGTVLGNAKNVKFHFDATYMQKAAAGK